MKDKHLHTRLHTIYHRLKAVVTGIVFCLAVQSCDKDIQNVTPDDDSIGLAAHMPNTRAELSDLQTDGFSVWGGYVKADGTAQQVFTGTEVTYDNTNGWGYTPAKYWNPGKTYNFFGVYPQQDANKITPSISDNKVYYHIDFALPTTADTDLLVATPAPITANKPYSTVNMEFTHVLSKINLNVQKNGANDEDEVIVRAVSINNIRATGQYKSKTNAWEETTNGSLTFTNLNVELSDTEQRLVLGDKMLIPQTIEAESVQLSIYYSIKSGNSTDYFTANAYLPNSTISEWENQKIYTYNMTLGAANNNILFGIPNVNDWERNKPVGGSVMIQ